MQRPAAGDIGSLPGDEPLHGDGLDELVSAAIVHERSDAERQRAVPRLQPGRIPVELGEVGARSAEKIGREAALFQLPVHVRQKFRR